MLNYTFFLIFCALNGMCDALIPKHRNFLNTSKSFIPDDYVKEMRPPTLRTRPVEVLFSIRVVDINSINVEDMDFREEWVDPRIKIPEEMFDYGDESITLPAHNFEKLWLPDLYFLNSKVVEIAGLTQKFSSITIFRNKTIKYSARMHAIVACQMEFQWYPMDTQICPISVESFSYNYNKMHLKWSQKGVTVIPELKLLQYNILPLVLEEENVYSGEKTGNFSRLIVFFKFERQIGHHLIQLFAPSTLVVVLSWFSFWLGMDAVPGRVTLLVTCLLTLVTMFTGLRSDIPAVAYIKALDLWMAGCMVSVFAAFVEFVIVKVLDRKHQKIKRKQCEEAMESAITPWSMLKTDCTKRRPTHHFIPLTWKNKKGKEKILWSQVDKASRVVFPVIFFLFCLIFWTTLVFGRASSKLIIN